MGGSVDIKGPLFFVKIFLNYKALLLIYYCLIYTPIMTVYESLFSIVRRSRIYLTGDLM